MTALKCGLASWLRSASWLPSSWDAGPGTRVLHHWFCRARLCSSQVPGECDGNNNNNDNNDNNNNDNNNDFSIMLRAQATWAGVVGPFVPVVHRRPFNATIGGQKGKVPITAEVA
ncbi:unnamed protein product [Polarella glacialis]|uniref:Uncharacterized protein n=1 Tax=Polarella glacialis TaxID=89957 RepID=A0A813EI65_POLGL|nr:unnamed protein product [Polarella glacialis]CAE8710843.1 unnamed protein product [Polarella glacialis]